MNASRKYCALKKEIIFFAKKSKKSILSFLFECFKIRKARNQEERPSLTISFPRNLYFMDIISLILFF